MHDTIRPVTPDRPTAATSDAWTCPYPGCGRSYWSPREWEPELWAAVREHARRIHGRRHAQERIEARDAGRPVPGKGGTCHGTRTDGRPCRGSATAGHHCLAHQDQVEPDCTECGGEAPWHALTCSRRPR
jgi:hypothetical protein